MKKYYFIFFLLAFLASDLTYAQKLQKDTSIANRYRRSSLCLMLLNDNKIEKAEFINTAFKSLPVPDKFDDLNISERVFETHEIELNADDLSAFATVAGGAKKKKSGFSNFVTQATKELASESSGGLIGGGADRDEYAAKAHKILLNQKAAKSLVDKWFIDSTGNFSVDLIKQRGLYDASAYDISVAQNTVLKNALLEDAGFELLNNSFVIVSHFNYLPKDSVVAELAATANTLGAIAGVDIRGYTALAGSAAGMTLGDGYFVKITAFLFKLNWNDSLQAVMNSQLWNNHQAYKSAEDLFSLQYLGSDKEFANVKASIFKNKPEEELIYMATVNAMDKVLVKLQKKQDVFKTKTPLIVEVGENQKHIYTAQIGLKEGLEPGDKFDVLEMVQDASGKTTYEKRGVLKVSKKQIWDNRFGADEELKLKNAEQSFNATLFEGEIKGAYSGMLLRQAK